MTPAWHTMNMGDLSARPLCVLRAYRSTAAVWIAQGSSMSAMGIRLALLLMTGLRCRIATANSSRPNRSCCRSGP